MSSERVAQAAGVADAPLGTFVVAKPDQGIPTVLPPWRDGQAPLEVPVYDQPFGDARVLVSAEDGLSSHPLLHSGRAGPPLVLRVIAGGPGDDWIKVEAPAGTPGRSVWVRAFYFDFDFTSTRLEVDVAAPGHVRLIQGGSVLVDSPLDGNVTIDEAPQVTYVSGRPGSVGDDLTSALTSGLGIAGEAVVELAHRLRPGTPVVIVDSSTSPGTRADDPARTVPFADNELLVGDAALLPLASAWVYCEIDAPICRRDAIAQPDPSVPIGNIYLTAKDDGGRPVADAGRVIAVYDEPNGPERMLVDTNDIDGVELAYPLYNPTPFDQPLVLRVLPGAPGDQWVLVQAPIRPHRQSVWVRAADFEWGTSLKRIEVDLGRDGLVTLFDHDVELISSLAVYGRESRPTTLHDTYVEQAFEGRRLSPAYGSHILTLASYSNALGTFGGGGLPGQSLHGTNQPELIGQRVSSGGIRVPDDVATFIYEQPDIIGASVIIYDSAGIGRDAAIQLQRSPWWFPANTRPQPAVPPLPPIPSYS